jgi:UDP-glucose 4-epimerase
MGHRAMVLGATGFIGRHLVDRLTQDGWDVVRLVRPTSHDGRSDVETVTIPDFASGLGDAVLKARPETVFNLASAGVGRRVSDAELTSGNVGVVQALVNAIDADVTRLVLHAGSWSQYGPFAGTDAISEGHPQRASTPYGTAKAQAEAIGTAIGASRSVRFVALRLFNVFGPGEASHRLIPYIVESAVAGVPAELTTGSQVRDFVYVEDVVNAFISCADSSPMDTGAFNVATGLATSVRELAEMTQDEVGAERSTLAFGEKKSRVGEPSCVVGDASALSARTGWHARTSVSDGVRDTVRWALEHTRNHG